MKKVVIIGAGPAGITAAAELQKQDKDISVTGLRNWLDANEIPYTFHLKDGAHDFNVWIKTLAEFLQYSLWKE